MNRGGTTIPSAIQDLLRQHGIDSTLEQARHIKVRFHLGGRKQMYVCSRTGSCPRAAANALADVRRMLRHAGISAS